jgi:elongation of very long chain fatty acids protein 6
MTSIYAKATLFMSQYLGDFRVKPMDDSMYTVPNSAKSCRGDHYVTIEDVFPSMKSFTTQYERDYNSDLILNWMKNDHYVTPITAVIIYVLFVFWIGPYIMSKYEKGFNLTYSLAAWNLSLSLFSWWGVTRTVPFILYRIFNETFEDTVCKAGVNTYAHGTTGFATVMFILSKIPELGDTIFLVVKKKPVIFLHWYHHITVLLFCWNSYVTESSCGLYFVAMNYTVHALMYFYFFLMAIKSVPKWFPPVILTFFQISQMFVGVGVVSAAIYYHYYSNKIYKYKLGTQRCSNDPSNMIAGCLMYSSYLYLFIEFALKRFVFNDKTKVVFDAYWKHFIENVEKLRSPRGSEVDLKKLQ